MFEEYKFFRNYRGVEKRWENLYWKKNPQWYLQFKKFPDEKFTEIDGYYGFYFISNYGQVISFYQKFPRVRKLNFVNGFFSIQLHLLGISSNQLMHNLVYAAFIGPLKPGQRIIHKNRITTDNYYKNLKSVRLSPSVKRIEGKLFDFSLFNQIEAEAADRPLNTITVLQFDWDGTFIKEYPSVKKAAVCCGLTPRDLCGCMKGERKTVGKYQWRYKRDAIFKDGICNIEPVKYKRSPFPHPVLQFDLQGNFIREYPSVSKAVRVTNCHSAGIYACAAGIYRKTGIYRWHYKDDPLFKNGIINIGPMRQTVRPSSKSVLQFDLQGNFIKEYPSISAAAGENGIRIMNIFNCLRRKNGTSCGFQWKLKSNPLFANGIVNIEPVIEKKKKIRNQRKRRKLLQFNKGGKFLREYDFVSEAAQEIGVSSWALKDCLQGKSKTCGGFQWRYKNETDISSSSVLDIEPVKYNPSPVIRPVVQFDPEGNFIREYPSISQAKRVANIRVSSISSCALGKYKTAGGFQWRYRDDPLFKKGIVHIGPAPRHVKPNKKAVLQFDMEGNFVKEYTSISAAASELEVKSGNIYACLKGKIKSCGGFQWKYKDDPYFANGVVCIKPVAYPDFRKSEPVFQFDLEGKFIKKFDSAAQAAREINVSVFSLYSCCQGKSKSCGGFQWRYQKGLPGDKKKGRSYIRPLKPKNKKYDKIYQFSRKGKFIAGYASIEGAVRELGIRLECIRNCLCGSSKTAGGYQWRSAHDRAFKKEVVDIAPVEKKKYPGPKPVVQFHKSGIFMREYSSVNEAARKSGVSVKRISWCAEKKTKLAAGFQWRYLDDPIFKDGIRDLPQVKIKVDGKPVLQFDLMGNFFAEYPSIAKAADAVGTVPGHIHACLRGSIRTSGKSQWRWKSDPVFRHGIVNIGPVEKIEQYNHTAVLQFDREGKFIRQYPNIKEAARDSGLKIANIRDCFNGRSRTAAGFQWRTIHDPAFKNGITNITPVKISLTPHAKPVVQLDLENNPVNEFSSMKQAAKAAGICPSAISNCIKGNRKAAGGFIWRLKK